MKITNLTGRPQILDDGTIVAAAGTEGSSKSVETLSERDRKRLVGRGAIHVEETTVVAGPASESPKAGELRSAPGRQGRSISSQGEA